MQIIKWNGKKSFGFLLVEEEVEEEEEEEEEEEAGKILFYLFDFIFFVWLSTIKKKIIKRLGYANSKETTKKAGT